MALGSPSGWPAARRRAAPQAPPPQVDAVEQRARQLALVARHLLGRAAAGAALAGGLRAQPAAGAGVHRRHQLEARRELRLPRGAGDGDAPGLQRLAQRLQRRRGNSGSLVQEEHAAMRQRDLARPRR
jgi:hypothetical protein